MSAEYVSKHKMAQTIEAALTEALATQPDNPYEALSAWFAGGGAKTVGVKKEKKAAPEPAAEDADA
jgi:hypothetical protein